MRNPVKEHVRILVCTALTAMIALEALVSFLNVLRFRKFFLSELSSDRQSAILVWGAA